MDRFWCLKVRGSAGAVERVAAGAPLVRPAGAAGASAALLRVPAAVSQRRSAFGFRENPSLSGAQGG